MFLFVTDGGITFDMAQNTKATNYWRRQLVEKVRRNPQIRLDQLADYIQVLGRDAVIKIWSARKRRVQGSNTG